MAEIKSSAPNARYAKATKTAQKLRAHFVHSRAVLLFDIVLVAFNEKYPSWSVLSSDFQLWAQRMISLCEKIAQTLLFEEEQQHYSAISAPAAVAAVGDADPSRKRADARTTCVQTIARAEAEYVMAIFRGILVEVERVDD